MPILVDSATRRRLNINFNHGVLFVLGTNGAWLRLAYIDDDYRRLLDTVLAKMPSWHGVEHHRERFALFASLLNHSNAALRRLALQEMDRVPYAMLRAAKVRLSPRDLVASLNRRSDRDYWSINFLLLGLTRSNDARADLHDRVERMKPLQIAEGLGAAATALIELEGLGGVYKLERLFLLDPDQSMSKVEAVVEAMAIHSSVGTIEVRQEIEEALVGFVTSRPNGVEAIARQFSARRDWSFGPRIEKVLEAPGPLSASSRLFASVYVAQAKVNQAATGP